MKKQKQWQIDLDKEARLAKAGREHLYDRIRILVDVEKTNEFNRDNKETDLPSFFDARVSDSCATFSELKQILKLWPRKEQWQTGNLATMRREMLQIMHQRVKNTRARSGQSISILSDGDALEGEVPSNVPKPSFDKATILKMSWKAKYFTLEQEHKTLQAAHRQLEKDYRAMKSLLRKKAG